MGVTHSETNVRASIRTYLHDYLQAAHFHHTGMTEHILALLSLKGKILNEDENLSFTWGEFSYYISLLFNSNKGEHHNRIAFAAAVELLILSADIMDDIADGDHSLVYQKLDLSVSTALTIANSLLVEAFQLIYLHSKTNDKQEIYKVLHHLRTACTGQWNDLSFTVKETFPSEEEYFFLIKQKSVSLVQLIFDLNCHDHDPIIEQISTYIGYSGQLINDAMDIFPNNKGDLLNKKATLPIIKALEYSNEKHHGWLLEKLQRLNSESDDKLLSEIKLHIKQSGSIDYCLILAKFYKRKACYLINEHFPNKKEITEKLLILIG